MCRNVCAYLFAFKYIRMRKHKCQSVYGYMYVYICVYIKVYTWLIVYFSVSAHLHLRINMHECMHVCVWVCKCTHQSIMVHTHLHTHIYIFEQLWWICRYSNSLPVACIYAIFILSLNAYNICIKYADISDIFNAYIYIFNEYIYVF